MLISGLKGLRGNLLYFYFARTKTESIVGGRL